MENLIKWPISNITIWKLSRKHINNKTANKLFVEKERERKKNTSNNNRKKKMPMDNNTNKLINNGYLRTPYITKNNGHGTNTNSNSNATVTGVTSKRTNNVDAGGGGGGVGVNIKSTEDGNDSDAAVPTVISPLLGVENKSELSATEVMHHSSLLPSQQQQQQQQQQHQQRPLLPCANNVGHTLKHPTVVYLDADSGKTIPGSGVVNTTLQHNVPVAYSPQTSSHHHHQSEWLIKESTLRCRLLVLAVALMVLGAAIGALAIYFAGGNYRCQTATHTIDKSRNINNNISTTGKCQNVLNVLFNIAQLWAEF